MIAVILCSFPACGGKDKEAGADKDTKPNAAGSKSKPAGKQPGKSRPNSRLAYQFESAKIEFEYTGVFSGKETFYVADWGETVAIVEDKTENGQQVSQTVRLHQGQAVEPSIRPQKSSRRRRA